MNNKISIFLAVAFLLGLCFTGCDERSKAFPDTIKQFPLEEGNKWTYALSFEFTPFENDSGDDNKEFLYYDEIELSINGDTLLEGNIPVIKTTEIRGISKLERNSYVSQTRSGLYSHGYCPGGTDILKKSVKGVHLEFELLMPVYDPGPLIGDGEIFIENPPRQIIRFPVTAGSEWTYLQPKDEFRLRIDKKVIGMETLSISGREFKCWKIVWDYSGSLAFEGIKLTEWIADEGIIQREVRIDSLFLSDEKGELYCRGNSLQTLRLKNILLR